MTRETLMVCKGFLSKLSPSALDALSTMLPPSQQPAFSALKSPEKMEPQERLKLDALDQIHPSWLSPYLRTLSHSDMRLFLAALHASQREKLEKQLGLNNHFPKLSKAAKAFFRSSLLAKITHQKALIPLGFLPKDPLNHLLDLSFAKLHSLIRYLGLHDLSFEMRQIISTKKLKEIFQALPKKEGEYLQSILLHREPLVFQRLFLEKWDGSKEQMERLLLERGAQRLACLLTESDPSFVWYLSHRMDMHTAALLLKIKDKPASARSDEIVMKQIEKILKHVMSE